jgi:DNA replication and repair protein RecF
MEYRLHGVDPAFFAEDPKGALLEGFKAHAAEESRRQSTAVGPHRDDIHFGLDERPARKFASQGQQRSLVLALKMAEIELIRKTFEAPPVLLLDDMTSELDQQRNSNLMEFLRKREMQVFITTTSLGNIALDESDRRSTFRINDGKII